MKKLEFAPVFSGGQCWSVIKHQSRGSHVQFVPMHLDAILQGLLHERLPVLGNVRDGAYVRTKVRVGKLGANGR